ncbi:hypothetical protein OH77DRAFT_659533 [Trametes cingulata]|nr:hypothetical protein OH77DRAFT_659533 [Trametes cingulata]
MPTDFTRLRFHENVCTEQLGAASVGPIPKCGEKPTSAVTISTRSMLGLEAEKSRASISDQTCASSKHPSARRRCGGAWRSRLNVEEDSSMPLWTTHDCCSMQQAHSRDLELRGGETRWGCPLRSSKPRVVCFHSDHTTIVISNLCRKTAWRTLDGARRSWFLRRPHGALTPGDNHSHGWALGDIWFGEKGMPKAQSVMGEGIVMKRTGRTYRPGTTRLQYFLCDPGRLRVWPSLIAAVQPDVFEAVAGPHACETFPH